MIVAMTAAGTTVLLDLVDGPPVIVHWGPELPGLTLGEAEALVAARVPLPGSNMPDVPARVSVLPEPYTGWLGRPGLVGSRATRFRTRDVRLDGPAIGGPGTVLVRCADAGLELDVEIELTPAGLLRSRATLTNVDDAPYSLQSLCLAYPVTGAELLDFAGRHNHERVPQRQPFTVGTHLRENRRGRTGADSAFVLHAGEPGFGFARGSVHGVHTAWSGNHVHWAEQAFTGERLLGGGELLGPGEIVLRRGDSYTSPWLYGGWADGLDALAHRFHRHVRSRPLRPRPVTLNVWEAVWFDHDESRLVALAEQAAAIGVERFVLDDGWFGARRHDRAGLGDWVVSPEVWPRGLHPLIDRVRGLGMEFGLWVEPEMVNPDSDLARAHPEWIVAARAEWPVESRHQQVLDLANPGAYAHVRGQLLALLAEYDIAYLKWDHNRDLIEASTVHAQTLAVYRLLDELRAARPGLEIESCASGGGRVDLGILERTERVWVSDCLDPHDRQEMLRWTGQLLPPEYLGSHIGGPRSHATGRVHDPTFRALTAVFGHLGVEQDLALASEAELASLRFWIAWWKEHRALFATGDVVRLDGAGGGSGADGSVWVHGVVAPDRSHAVFAVVGRSSAVVAQPPPLRLRGLDPARRYRVAPVGELGWGVRIPTWEGAFSGAVLEHAGLAGPDVPPDQALLLEIDSRPNG
jgi:alpha-galactosidase